MTNRDILAIAMQQSAIDSNCSPEDFSKKENIVVISGVNEKARRYLQLPFVCDLTTYGSNIVASVSEDLKEDVTDYINTYDGCHCFETPNLHVLMEKLRPKGLDICFMAEYFLPDMNILRALACDFEMKVLEKDDFADCYRPEWGNALCESRKHLDMLAVGAFDNGKLIGLAGASADCDTMWQIGVDVLPEYRKKGIAAAITSRLACEIVKRDKVPFYCCAWSNIASVRNAVKSGFRPAWVQVTAKKTEEIEKFNHVK